MNYLNVLVSLFLVFFSNLFIDSNLSSSFIYNGRFLTNIVESITFYSNGLKKQYADILYIRMLQYYGKRNFNYDDYLGGNYPLMYPMVRDISIVDSSYVNSIVLGSTILAFGLKETVNAKSVLKIAIISNPVNSDNNLKYLTILAAIVTYENNKKNIYDEQTLFLLYNAAMEKGTTDMFKNIVAFLCLKGGKRDLAISLYNEIVKTSANEYYKKRALEHLKELKVL